MESLPHSEEITAEQTLGELWSRFNQRTGGSFSAVPKSAYEDILIFLKAQQQHRSDDGAAWFLLSFSWRLCSCVGVVASFARCESQSRFRLDLLIALMTMLNAETFRWINCVTICANNCSWSASCASPRLISVSLSTWLSWPESF